MIDEPENTEEKQTTKFRAGESGNPNGRPKGSRNKATIAALELLEGEAEEITRAAIEEAKAGNMIAIKLCLDRIAPPTKQQPMQPLDLPVLKTAADIPIFYNRINELLADGEISESELTSLTAMAGSFQRAIDISELETRIQQIETTQK